MPNPLRVLGIALAAQVVVLLSWAARADDLLPEAFYGSYVGYGFTHGDLDYYEATVRDLDVEIGPEKDGFFVAWTTVLHPPDGGEPRRRSSRISFVPSERPSIYVERSARKGNAEGLAWAAINGRKLTVHVLTIGADGSYDLQTYHRTLLKKGMAIQFRSDHNGKIIRMISGRVTKVSSDAKRWLERELARAECGDANSQFQLGRHYQFGSKSGARSKINAFFWYSLASRQGRSEVEGALDLLRVEMSPEQIAEAKRLVTKWEPADC